jgi:glycosyltransferase involved in cell wall biosynthesis
MANAQDHTWTADELASTAGEAVSKPKLLLLGPSDLRGATVATSVASGLLGEGWTATALGAGDGVATVAWKTSTLRNLIDRLSACEVVHIFCASSRQILREALPTLVLARFVGRRSVLHFVTSDIELLLENHRRLLAPMLKLADGIVVGSRHLQKTLTRVGLNARVLTAPVSTEGITHRVRRRLQPKILVVTPLEIDANVQAAIRAFRLVKQKYPRAELVVIGEGTQRRTLEQFVEKVGVSGVSFVGEVDETGVARAMGECDLYLHAPLADESPVTLVKAFAAGLPVVTSDADGLLHMVRDRVNALIVPIGDHVGLSDAILELVENEELCIRLSEQGKQESEKYSWSRVRQDWANLYNTLR